MGGIGMHEYIQMEVSELVMSAVRQRLRIQSSNHLHSILLLLFNRFCRNFSNSFFFFLGRLAPCEIALTSAMYNAERRKRKVAAATLLAYG